MRILHVIDKISQTIGGGSATACYNLARAQAKLGHDVTIYSSDYFADGLAPPRGVKMVLFRCKANIRNKLIVAPDMLNADYSCDIMHLHNAYTLVNMLAANSKMTYVLQPHGSLRPHPLAFMWNRVVKRAARCIADSDKEIEQFEGKGVDRSKIALIPVGINLGEYRNLPEREPGDTKRVLFLGRFDRTKGLDLLIKAFSKVTLPNVRLLIAGIDYGVEDKCRRLADEFGVADRIAWLGPLYGADKVKTLAMVDLMVMPSLYEMWGIVFMEALAVGTPVVMTDTCEAAKLLPPECGLVSRYDESHLAITIEIALNEDMASKWRTYRRKWVSKYSWAKIAPRTISLYEEILEKINEL